MWLCLFVRRRCRGDACSVEGLLRGWWRVIIPELAGECAWEVRDGKGLMLLVRWDVTWAVWLAVGVVGL